MDVKIALGHAKQWLVNVMQEGGIQNVDYIPTHKRLKEYTIADFDLLKSLISASAGVAVTPNALSEASNLLRQINEPAKTQIARGPHSFIAKTQEIYVKSADASSRSEFLRIGLSDSVLLEISKNDIVVLTVDFDLCNAA